MGKFIDVSDLTPFDPGLDGSKGEEMIVDAEANAMLAAPCLKDSEALDEFQLAAVKSILRGAILRWNDSGDGATTQLSAGPFSKSITPQVRRNSFWPSEAKDLQRICSPRRGLAFTIDQTPVGPPPTTIDEVRDGAP